MWKSKDPWRCLNCSKLNRYNINCCGDCGGHWEDFLDPTFVPPSQQQGQHQATSSTGKSSYKNRQDRQKYAYLNYTDPWYGEDWDYASDRESNHSSRSPRQRAQPPRQRQPQSQTKKPKQLPQHKGAHRPKGQGKGKGKGKPAIEPPPWSSVAPKAKTSPPTVPTPAEAKLLEIVNVLKKKDDPELQSLAKEADVLNNKNATSKLHRAVAIHGDAKTALLEARQARANLHASWRQYLDSAVETWKSFIEDFNKEDKRLEEEIGKSDAHLSAAQEALDEAKKAATAEELSDQVETIEDEEELDRTVKSSAVMRDGLNTMLNGLEQIRAKTDELGDDIGNKRQRTDDGRGQSSAMQPFGGAGR